MPIKFEIKEARHGGAFNVRVVTRADRLEMVGVQDDGSLKIRLTESPAEGRANAQLIEFLAEILDVDAGTIEIVAGQDQPNKIISVEGVSPGYIEERLVHDR